MTTKISVLLPDSDAARFEKYCSEHGYKKSTYIAKLIKDVLDKEHFPFQESLIPGFNYPQTHRSDRK